MADDRMLRKKELLRRRLAADGLTRAATNAPVPSRADGATSALSVAQRRLWFVQYRDAADTSLNVGVAYRLDGAVDPARLRRAFDAVVARHEILRTTYELGADGEPVARHHAAGEVAWREVELGQLTGRILDRRVQVLARREFGLPFDLSSDCPLRVTLLRSADDVHILLLTVHHICWDDESWPVLFGELSALYDASDADPASLPPLARQYLDLPDADGPDDLAFWRNHLTPPPEPIALPGASHSDERGSALTDRPIDPDLAGRVEAFARAHAVSPFTVYAAATDVLVHRITGARDFTVAVPVTHRPDGSAELIGYFGNTLLLRTRLDPTDSFADVTATAGARLLNGFAHQSTPVDTVVSELNPGRAGGDGLAELVTLSLSVRGESAGPTLSGVRATALRDVGTPNDQLPLEFTVVTGAHPRLELEYSTGILTDELATGLADAYLYVLDRAVAQPGIPVRDLELLDPTTRARVLAASTGHQTNRSDVTVVDLIATVAAARPDHEAVVADDVSLTYRQLTERSRKLAHWLIRSGIGPEDLVGLRMGGSVEFVVAALAVLESGAAYLPIDPEYPDDRVAFLIADAAPRVVLDRDDLARAEAAADLLGTDVLGSVDDARIVPLRPDNLAYVIYTSGSTGTPKGVPVAHNAIADHLVGFGAGEVLTGDDRLVQTSSVSFDASMFEVFCTLSVGATLVIPKPNAVQDISYMADLLVRQRVTVMHMVPTLLSTLLLVPEVKQWTMLRTVPVGGEAMSGEVADAFTSTFDAALSNNYGPTEAVVAATHFPVDGPQGNRIVPIGTPNTNVTSYVLDAGLHLVPDGVVGEIYLGGAQLARGYLGRPALTAGRFVADPFHFGGRLYRTGDLARRNADGDLEFVGRADEQVKIRGYRIELGEIEAALGSHPDVAHAVVLVDSDAAGARLIAHLVPEAHTGGVLDLDDILRHTRAAVPEYMVPSALGTIAEVPLTVHGKLDREALPIISVSPRSDRAPSTPTEKRVAAVYAEIFGHDEIGAESSFFDLGGHSLLAARLVTILAAEFGIDVDVRLALDHPTVAGLAGAVVTAVQHEFGIDLDEMGDLDDIAGLGDVDATGEDNPSHRAAAPVSGRPLVCRVDEPDPIPLSFSQLAMWFQQRFEGAGAAGNIPLALRLDGPLDIGALHAALGDVVARHATLRTTFAERDGLPTARIHAQVRLDLPIVDVASPGARDAELAAGRAHEFDLATAPLIAPKLLRESETRHTLALVVHHMVIDHWSTDVLIADLITGYQARVAGRAAQFTPLPLTYTDYAVWQHRLFGVGASGSADELAEFGRAEIEHWRATLDGAPEEISVATDRPRPPALTKSAVLVDLSISPEVRRAYRKVADDCGATEFMILAAAFTGLLSRLGGGDDISVGTPVAGRLDPGTSDLVGLYANMVALRTRTDGAPTVRDLIGRTRDTVLDAFTHQDVPIERLVEALNPRRTRSRNPLFQSMIHFRDADQNSWGRPLDADGDTTLRLLPVEQDTSFLDLNLNLVVTDDGGIDGRLVAGADLYDQDTVDGIAAALVALLGEFGSHPDATVASLDLPPLPGVITADQHAEDPTTLAALITTTRPRRVHAGPRTLAALQHTGSTDLGSVREWVVTEPGGAAALAESLTALSPGSRITDPFQDTATAVVAMAATAGGGAETPTEERLIAILFDLLGIDGLGRDDNFFALGGDSVISIQWAARAAAEGLPLAPQQIFDHYTIAELAEAVDAAADAGVPDGATGPEDAAPMSASGLSDDLLASLGAAWKSAQ